mgnify:FL=1
MQILMIFSLPLLILNFIAPTAAIIWLLYLGQFNILLLALGAIFVSTFAYVIAMIPSIAILIPGAQLISKENTTLKYIGFLLLAIGGFWNYILMGLWTLFVFFYAAGEAVSTNSSDPPIIPYMLLAYSVSTASFSYMASKENSKNEGAFFATLVNQLSSAVFLAMTLLGIYGIEMIINIYIATVIICYLIGLFTGLLSEFQKNSLER